LPLSDVEEMSDKETGVLTPGQEEQ
jgi:hypothetical protein